MNDLHQLHETKNEIVLWWLQHELRSLRRGLGGISQAIQSDAGGPSLRPDTAKGGIEPGPDCGGDSGEGVKA